MPGIFGAFHNSGREKSIFDLAEGMIHSMNHGGQCRIDRFVVEELDFCMGRVSLGILNAINQPVVDDKEDCRIVFHGELYNNPSSLSDPRYVLEQYLKIGNKCVAELTGVFHFALYDKRLQQIKLFSDKFGLQPLYYSLLPDGLVFGAEVKALLEDEKISRDSDYESIADFLQYGQILGQKTLFKNIGVLPPGSVFTYGMKNGGHSLEQYWVLESLFAPRGKYDAELPVSDVVSCFRQSVMGRSKNKDILGLSLSAGLDSRGILASLGADAAGIRTYTLGLPGCADQKLAERMARVARTRHEFIELEQQYIENFEDMALSMIRLSDGMYHPHESTEMLALEYFKRAPFRVLLRGHGGETAKAALAYPVMVTPEVHGYSSSSDILRFIFKTTNLVVRDVDPGRLFTPTFLAVMKEAPMRSLRESCGTVSETLAPADVCIYYYVNEHIRRQVVASLEIFRTRVEIRMPYVDETYLERLLKLPVELRNRGEVHHQIVRECMPGLIKIPDSNTGAPLDAGAVRLFLTDKFTSLMKRLSVKGFRHYTEFQKWHREGFSRSSQKIIFSDHTASRNIYNMDHLASIFESHMTGKKDYGHLLGTIVGLELWFRCFADQPGCHTT